MSTTESFHPSDIQELSPQDQALVELLASGRLEEIPEVELTERRDRFEELFRITRPPYVVPQD